MKKLFIIITCLLITCNVFATDEISSLEDYTQRGWICLIFGLVLIAGTLYFIYSQYILASRGARAMATVLSFIEQRTDKGIAYSPFVSFTTHEGKEIEMQLPEASNPPAFKVDEQVIVYFDPDNINNISTLNYKFIIFSSAMMFVGAALVMAGVYFFTR